MRFDNVRVLGEDFKFRTGSVTVSDGVFSDKPDCARRDCSGLMMLPGLVDIHTHGALGFDNMDETLEAQRKIGRFMLENGVTTFLPTIMTETRERLVGAAKNIASAIKCGTGGARIGGIYMEGPYFSPKYKGAQCEDFLRDPDFDEFCEINEASDGIVRVVSLAPERSGAAEFIKKASGVCRVAMGHTDADFDSATAAIAAGATVLTHTFNAMRPLKHREPNAIGAALGGEVMCECIADGKHVAPTVVKILYNAVGADRLVLISDSLRCAGLPDGNYTMADGREIVVKNSLAYLTDGTIAGSSAKLFDCVKNAVSFGIPLEDAVKVASLNPARAAGIDNVCGVIKEGRAADFLLVDENLELKNVYIGGECFL